MAKPMDADRSRQLALELSPNAAIGPEAYVVGPANERAVRHLGLWPDWPHPIVYVAGPSGSGKTHLARIWAERAGANSVVAGNLSLAAVTGLPQGPVLVDDLVAGGTDDTALFHLINRQLEHRDAMVITSRARPSDAGHDLPDLRSRLRAATLLTIDAPDEQVLEAVLVKLLADRQLDVAPQALRYAMTRMDRSFDAAAQLVTIIDQISLEEKRRVTIPLVERALSRIASRPEPHQ